MSVKLKGRWSSSPAHRVIRRHNRPPARQRTIHKPLRQQSRDRQTRQIRRESGAYSYGFRVHAHCEHAIICPDSGSPGRQSGFGGLSRNCGSFMIRSITSIRKPSTPRLNQKRMLSYNGRLDVRIQPIKIGLTPAQNCEDSTGQSARQASTLARQNRTTSCSADRHLAQGRARYTSPGADCRATTAIRETMHAHARCDSAQNQAGFLDRAGAPALTGEIEVFEIPVVGVNREVVRDIVAEILHRGR